MNPSSNPMIVLVALVLFLAAVAVTKCVVFYL